MVHFIWHVITCNDRKAFFTSSDQSRYTLWSCQNVCDALSYLLDNIYIRFGTKLYRQIVGIPMGTNCAPLVADLFLYCYERDFMDSLNHDNQADVIEAFAPELVGYSAPRDLHRRAANSICESWFLIHQDVYHDLFVCS